MSIDEKIEIFKKFAETKEKLTGKTEFNGYPIGQWGIQIRSQFNRGKINLSKKQYEELEKLGILKRQIDSKIDEKIDEVIKWCEKYPKLEIALEQVTKKQLKGYCKSIDEYERIIKEYDEVSTHYDYIRRRKSEGRLTQEQIEKCRNGNVRGVFGFSEKLLMLSKKYRIIPSKINYIISKYGSMEEFLKANREGRIDEEDLGWLGNSLTDIIDISNKNSRRYDLLYRVIKGITNSDIKMEDRGLQLVDYEKMREILESSLTPRETEVIIKRFGLDTEKPMALEEIGKILEITKERVRVIESKSLRKLRRPSILNKFDAFNINKHLNLKSVNEENKKELMHIRDKIYNSNAIFIPDKEYESEPSDLNIEGFKEIIERCKESQIMSRSGIVDVKNIVNIVELNLSVRAYNCLKRAGIDTIYDLLNTDNETIRGIRNLKRKYFEEVVEKKEEILRARANNNPEGIDEENTSEAEYTIEKIYKYGIAKLGLSVRAYNCLKRAGINTIEDLLNTDDEMIRKIRSIGTVIYKEIKGKKKELLESGVKNNSEEGIGEKSELEELKEKREELLLQVHDLEQQRKTAKELLASYDKLLNGNTQSNVNSGPDFKDE